MNFFLDSILGFFSSDLAIDLGTTTVALYLVNLKSGKIIDQTSFINPQAVIGGDVMSRLKRAMEDGGLD